MSVVLNAIAVAVLGEESGSLNADLRANLLCQRSRLKDSSAMQPAIARAAGLTEYFLLSSRISHSHLELMYSSAGLVNANAVPEREYR
jgi:hypothetical protein